MCDNGWFLTSVFISWKNFVTDSCWASFQFLKLASITIHNISLSSNTIKHTIPVRWAMNGQEITWGWFSCWHHSLTMRQFEERLWEIAFSQRTHESLINFSSVMPLTSISFWYCKIANISSENTQNKTQVNIKIYAIIITKIWAFPTSRNYGISSLHVHN